MSSGILAPPPKKNADVATPLATPNCCSQKRPWYLVESVKRRLTTTLYTFSFRRDKTDTEDFEYGYWSSGALWGKTSLSVDKQHTYSRCIKWAQMLDQDLDRSQCSCTARPHTFMMVDATLLYVWFLCVLFVPSVLWYCWLGLLTCKTVSHITYRVAQKK